MNNENLIPVKTEEEARELGRKGGLVRSDKKKFAAKLRCIKKAVKEGNLKTKDTKWLLERTTDSQTMALDIVAFIDEVRETCHPAQRVALINAYTNAQKMIHGERKIIDGNINHNVKAVVINIVQPEDIE